MSLIVPTFWIIFRTALLCFANMQTVDMPLTFERGEIPFAEEEEEV